MGSYVTAAGGETLKDLYRQLNPAMDYATFQKEVASVNGGPLKVLDGGALEFGQKLNLPDSLQINAKPNSLVSQALSSGPFDLSAAQQTGTIRINPATGTPVAAIDPSARQTAARVTETMSQKPVAPGENRKVDYLREGTPDAAWAKDTLAKLDPATKALSYEDAFKKYQEANKLTVDGKPGPETLRKMQEQAKANADLSKSRDPATQALMRWPQAVEDAAPAAKAADAAPAAKAADAAPAAKAADAAPAAKAADAAPAAKAADAAPAAKAADAAPAAKAADAAPAAKAARDVTVIEKEIASKKLEIGALQGAPDPASTRVRQQKIDGLKAEQTKLEASPEFKAVKTLRDNQAKLKSLEEDRMILPSGKDIEDRTNSMRKLREEVAVQEKAVAPFKAKVEADEKRITGDLFGLQHRYASTSATHHFDGQVANLRNQVATLETEMKNNPGYQALTTYREAKTKLQQLRADSMFMPSGGDIEKRMKAIEQAEAVVKQYEAAHTP